jgi:hypothetical protein
VAIAGEEETAVASFNYHQDHFSSVYGIEMAGIRVRAGPPLSRTAAA